MTVERLLMLYDIILTKQNNRYFARVREWPDIVAEEMSREAVLQRIARKLTDYLARRQVEVVQIEVPLPAEKPNPWLETFGTLKDDPTFDDLQREIEQYRKELESNLATV